MDNIGGEQNQRQRQEKGNTVLLTVIGVATLLVALVGATFAYFTATVNNNRNQSVTITTATGAQLQYTTTDQIALSNAVPSASDTGKFTVTNPSQNNTVTYTYDLDLIVTINEFVTTEGTGQLTFVITPSSTGSNTPTLVNYGTTTDMTAVQAGTYHVVADQTIAVGETQTYDSVLTFVDTNSSQNTNQGKSFAAHFDISDVKSA